MDGAVSISLTGKDQFETSFDNPRCESWRANIRYSTSQEKVFYVTHLGNIQVMLPCNKKRNETKPVIGISLKRF